MLLDETDARYAPDGPGGAPQLVVTERRRKLILKPITPPPLLGWYERSFTRVESMRGRIVKPDGTEERLDESNKVGPPQGPQLLLHREPGDRAPRASAAIGGDLESEVVTRHLDVKPFVIVASSVATRP